MIETNRLTILFPDSLVVTDYCSFLDLDLSNAGAPPDVRCLQWLDGSGHIEYIDTRPNTQITELPNWAINCLNIWEQELDKSPYKEAIINQQFTN